MLNKIITFARSPWYWAALIVMGLSMEAVALYFQYGLDLGPCFHCIYSRIWVLGMVLVALLGLGLYRFAIANILLHALNTGLMFGLLHTSQQLLATERHTIFGSCDMVLGLPSWFALDSWFPSVFAVWEPCGETPELLFGITMAEGLTVFSWGMLLLSGVLLLAQLIATLKSNQS